MNQNKVKMTILSGKKIVKTFGIGEFKTGFSMIGNVMPLIAIPVLFALSAWFYPVKLSRVSIVELISEDGE